MLWFEPENCARNQEVGPEDRSQRAFTLIELLVVIAIIAILAAILFPVFTSAKRKAQQTTCLSNMKQIGSGLLLYLNDNDDRLPDRRDLKSTLPGGYKPWTSWPTSDPRCAWAAIALQPYTKSGDIWKCPVGATVFKAIDQVRQPTGTNPPVDTYYWMWRFDRPDDPVPLDNLWGKTESQAVDDLRAANNPQVGIPDGTSDVEILVDPYFPRTIPSVPNELKGKAVHFGGRNRLFLDLHAKFLKDARTD